jgi:4-hydroxyphenylpyruvate dioxygenase
MGFRVADAEFSKDHALKLGAIDAPDNKSLNLSAIQGVGSSIIYFINDAELTQFFEAEFDFIAGIDPKPFGTGLTYIDHLTHNVKRGHMDEWAGFYERIFNFKEIRYFNIKGKMTGLLSRAMTSPCGKIRIPINESSDDKSQIEEFITTFNGEGIQHIALGTDDIYHSVDVMSRNGIDFLNTPDVYFDMLQQRLPWHKENPEKLRELKILIDGDKTPDNGLLLQIFTENMLGPVFFEIIQRKGNEGFGEGNFQALFEAIERDQMQRGKL